MSNWIKTTVQAMVLGALPLMAAAGSAPTVFALDNAQALRLQAHNLASQKPDLETARKLALVVINDASQRKDGTLAQIQADQALVLRLVELTNGDPEIRAVHANLVGMEAGIEQDLMRVLALAKASTRALDLLVRDNPDVGGTYMQRGLNALHSPKIARRGQIAIADFKTLSEGDFNLSPDRKAEAKILLARAYLKAGQIAEARPLLVQVAKADLPLWSDAAQSILASL